MRLRVRRDLAILIGALLLASACATPVGVVRGDPLARQNPDAISLQKLGGLPTAVDNMLPGQRFVRMLSASRIAPGVTVNSIVAVLGKGPITGLGDGVVMYKSAHLEGVGTELVVHSGHSTQARRGPLN